jgi:hypothetical protein
MRLHFSLLAIQPVIMYYIFEGHADAITWLYIFCGIYVTTKVFVSLILYLSIQLNRPPESKIIRYTSFQQVTRSVIEVVCLIATLFYIGSFGIAFIVALAFFWRRVIEEVFIFKFKEVK